MRKDPESVGLWPQHQLYTHRRTHMHARTYTSPCYSHSAFSPSPAPSMHPNLRQVSPSTQPRNLQGKGGTQQTRAAAASPLFFD